MDDERFHRADPAVTDRRRPGPLRAVLVAVLVGVVVAASWLLSRSRVPLGPAVRAARGHPLLRPEVVALPLLVALVCLLALVLVLAARSRRDGLRHVRVAAELAETGERFRSLFAFSPQGVLALDLEGRLVAVNAAMAELLGRDEDELRGTSLLDLLRTGDHAQARGAIERLKSRYSVHLELPVRHARGHLVELDVTGMPIVVGEAVVGIHAVARNVTERNRLMRDLRRATDAAHEADDAKQAFMTGVSHEMRTPLTSVLAAAELLEDTDLDDLQRDLVVTVGRAGRRLLGLVDNLLDVAKLEAGRTELDPAPVELRTLVEEITSLAEPRARQRGLGVSWRVGRSVPEVVVGDAVRIAQVLTNLLGNAVKFTESGWVRVEVTRGRDDAGSTVLVFSVTDTGVGITAEQQARLFRSFSQADASIARRYGGTGLGLALSRHLVELMGGRIWVESRHRAGSRFSFHLPLVEADEPVAAGSGTPTAPSPAAVG